MISTRALRLLLTLCLAGALTLSSQVTRDASADGMSKLTRALLHADNHKERISAAVSLARLKDPRTLDAFVEALRDNHRTVRAIAASALGSLGDRRALPALRRSARDRDDLVRKRAARSIETIESSGGYQVSRRRGEPGFGQSPRAIARPRVHLVLKSVADESRAATRRRARTLSTSEMKRSFRAQLEAAPEITTSSRVARKLRIERFNLDVSVMRLSHARRGGFVDVECRIRVAVSDKRGKMLSFLNGAATVKVPRNSFDERQLAVFQREAIENAVKAVQRDLLDYLTQRHNPS